MKNKLTISLLVLTLCVAAIGITTVQAKDAPVFRDIYKVFSSALPGLQTAPAADPMTGNLTATGGLQVYDLATGAFVPFTGTTFKAGDCFFTGPETQTTLAFTPNSSANVGPNSEFCLTEFSIDPATGVMELQFEAAIGTFELDMNEAPGMMSVALHTPVSVIVADGAGFSTTSNVVFPGTEGMTPEQLQAFIASQPIFMEKTLYENADGSTSVAAFDPALLVDFAAIDVATTVTSGSAELSYITPDGVLTVPMEAGQTVTFVAPPITDPAIFVTLKQVFDDIIAGIEPSQEVLDQIGAGASPTTAPTTQPFATFNPPTATPKPTDVAGHCGNGVCEPYKGEDTLTCSADCAP